MAKSIFNTEFQQKSLTSKIVVCLERISEAFKSLLWEYAKTIGLSPIQIQMLIFISYHKNELCKVSYLANEFNVTKPTISDAVKVLEKKGFIKKGHSETDSRSYTILLTVKGNNIVSKTDGFAGPISNEIEKINSAELEILFKSLNKVIFNLNRTGILNVQRTCFACRFYEKTEKQHFCILLNKELVNKELRIDCPEFEESPAGNNV